MDQDLGGGGGREGGGVGGGGGQEVQTILIHCILVDSSTVICWVTPFVI